MIIVDILLLILIAIALICLIVALIMMTIWLVNDSKENIWEIKEYFTRFKPEEEERPCDK